MDWQQKYLNTARHARDVERKHRNCKQERLTRAVHELEHLRDNEALGLTAAAYRYIEERLTKLNKKRRELRRKGTTNDK